MSGKKQRLPDLAAAWHASLEGSKVRLRFHGWRNDAELFAVGPAFLDAQTSPDNRQVSVKRQILILLSHEWLERPSKISGTGGGAAFVCAATSKQGAYHLERKIPSAIATPNTFDEGVYESKLSDADLKTLLALADDVEVKAYAGPPPQQLSDTWQFVIARTNGFQNRDFGPR